MHFYHQIMAVHHINIQFSFGYHYHAYSQIDKIEKPDTGSKQQVKATRSLENNTAVRTGSGFLFPPLQ